MKVTQDQIVSYLQKAGDWIDSKSLVVELDGHAIGIGSSCGRLVKAGKIERRFNGKTYEYRTTDHGTIAHALVEQQVTESSAMSRSDYTRLSVDELIDRAMNAESLLNELQGLLEERLGS